MTKEVFLEKANIKHDRFYTYINLKDSFNQYTEIEIFCPVHGEFTQVVKNHLRGRGCHECGLLKRWATRAKPSTKDIIKRFKAVHGNLFDYSKVVYQGDRIPVKVICEKHGEFEITPNAHYTGNRGCRECRYLDTAKSMLHNQDDIIKRFKAVHGEYYDYSKVEYKGMFKKVEIICPVHGSFYQRPKGHLDGKACSGCNLNGGFDRTKKAIMYYLKINGGEAYKIGITNNTVNERFHVYDLKKIEVIHIEKFPIGNDAFIKEQKIIKEFKEFKYKGVPLLSSGNTELFSFDILGLSD